MTRTSKAMKVVNVFLSLVLLFSIFMNIDSYKSYAASTWKGYAVYRDGVVGNLNDHAALMDTNSINEYKPIIHAVGYGEVVQWDTWDNFLKDNNYLGIYEPKNCTISPTLANSFITKARELRGISYNMLDQIVYYAGYSTWVQPEYISHLRCDGVVEYVYEWYGCRVGGPDGKWDITYNSTGNYWEHSGFFITPRKQNQELLTFVSSLRPY